MNIGIDIDGTITTAPEFFREMTRAMKDRGHRVFKPVHESAVTETTPQGGG